jgi:hypothetical protein
MIVPTRSDSLSSRGKETSYGVVASNAVLVARSSKLLGTLVPGSGHYGPRSR